ncbi:MAG: Maf-like protein, partial [Lachnospiraceae bacterium]|nr:Maf-like protein [Lachnospiraceae bacterium]
RGHAYEMIEKLQGRDHTVHTGVSVAKLIGDRNGGYKLDAVKTFVEESAVSVVPMTEEEINDYISCDEPYDKAGGYAVQGVFAKYIKGISGDFYNIVGFPVCRFLMEIKNFS